MLTVFGAGKTFSDSMLRILREQLKKTNEVSGWFNFAGKNVTNLVDGAESEVGVPKNQVLLFSTALEHFHTHPDYENSLFGPSPRDIEQLFVSLHDSGRSFLTEYIVSQLGIVSYTLVFRETPQQILKIASNVSKISVNMFKDKYFDGFLR